MRPEFLGSATGPAQPPLSPKTRFVQMRQAPLWRHFLESKLIHAASRKRAAEGVMQWYYLVQGQRQGPVDDAGLDAVVRQGIVHDETLVWREGLTEWHAYGAVKPKPPTPPPRPEPIPPGLGTPPRSEPAPGWPEALPYPSAPPSATPSPASSGPTSSGSTAPSRAARPAAPRGAFFFYPVLDALSDGRVIQKAVTVCLKIAAFVFALAGLLGAVSVIMSAVHGTAGMALGGILFALIVLGTSACVAQIYWYRAASVAKLEHTAGYTVIPIFAVLSRASGEAAATALGGVGLGACLYFWLSPEGAVGAIQGFPMLSQVPAESGFLTGLIVLVYMAALGFTALILGYLWAECMILLLDIERNTRRNV